MIYFHVDVNSAFLSWSALELKDKLNKDIRDEVSVIGGDPKKRSGIVIARSNPAKKLGIKTAETLSSAFKKYKKLHVYPPNYEFYEKKSSEFFNFLKKFTPDIEQYSVDECFLKFDGFTYLYDDYLKLAHHIKDTINKELGYTVNIGIGPNKLLAKMAGDFEKPNKVHTLFFDELDKKFYPLDIRKLFMVGKKTEEKLRSMGINTILDLKEVDLKTLKRVFKKKGEDLYNNARGQDFSDILEPIKDEAISLSKTLLHDTKDEEYLVNVLRKQVLNLTFELRQKKKYVTVISVFIKYEDFSSFSKQKTLDIPLNNTNKIFSEVKEIFNSIKLEQNVRSIGVRFSTLVDEKITQVSFLEEEDETDDVLEKLIDNVNNKSGKPIVTLASFYHKK